MNRLIQEIQLADKYSRLKDDGTKETWPEVTTRVISFLRNELKKQNKQLPQSDWDTIETNMLSMDVLPSMRVVQMAGPALERDHVGAYNCFTGDTEYLTRDGVKTFVDTVDTVQIVLCADGKWRSAEVKKFGTSPVNVITFRPGERSNTGLRKIVRATADHGWLTTRGETRNLQVGDCVLATSAQADYDNDAWVKGFLFGDGTVQDNFAKVRLCGKKADYLERFQKTRDVRVSYPDSTNGDPVISWGKYGFADCKNLPTTPTPSWMQGYLAADGGHQERQPTITTTRKDVAEFLQQRAAELGIVVTGLTVCTTDSNFGPRKPLYKLGIRPAQDVVWRVLSIEPTEEIVDVFCVTEPVTHTFTLAHGLTSLNCAYLALDKPSALGELLYIMMQGTGVGFSVESRYVNRWPKVVADPKFAGAPMSTTLPFTILDSTEGWVEAFNHCIDRAMEGITVEFDYSRIRPAGAPLRTKGGYASGPDPLRSLLDFTTNIIRGAAGRQLRPIEVHRIATKAGSIVMVGGVRRAAQLSLSDAGDHELRDCKSGIFWLDMPELSMANNSAVFHSADAVSEEWPFLRSSGTGERGLFNPDGPIPVRRIRQDFGTNPCGEILLRSRQFCNLSIAVARPNDTKETLGEKVRVATILGTIQSCLTYFPRLPKTWKKNCEEERLLGVDITGTLDCPLLQHANDDTKFLLDHLKSVAVTTNKLYAYQLSINSSVAVTCNKPSGNSSQLLNCSSGIHPRYSAYYIRRLRIGRDTPLAAHLRSMGVPVFPEVGQQDLDVSPVWVFELPAKSPDGAIVRADVSAISQLEYWKMWKVWWTEHNPSCTIYVAEHEWDAVHQWVRDNWDIIGGLSFLPRDNHIYMLAPYEEITKEQYEKRVEEITWDGKSLTKWAGDQAGSTDAACTGDFCEF